MEYVLKRREKKELKFIIDGKDYYIPLSGSLPVKMLAQLDTPEGTMSFVKEYIPGDVVDSLTRDEYNELVKAWVEISHEDSGIKVGE
ncbi:MAG: hypothetical protein ACSW79_09530 [Eubacteriales bacterium]